MEVTDGKAQEWLSSYRNKKTRGVVTRIFNKFMEWVSVNGGDLSSKSPTEIWKYQHELNRQNMLNEDVNNRLILNVILTYLEEGGEWTTGYKKRVYYALKSFIDYPNGSVLPPVLNGEKNIFRSEKSVDTVEMDKFRQVVRDIVGASDNCHKAIYSLMAVSGMGPGEIVYLGSLGVDAVKKAMNSPVNRDPEIIELKLPSRKGNIGHPYHTYIGGGPLHFLKVYLDEREEMDTPLKEVFVTNFDTPVTANNIHEYWRNVLIRTRKYKSQPGRGGKRTGMNPHLIRHLFRTSWSISGARREMGEYSLGHFEKLPYDEITKNQKIRVKEYIKALPHLDLWTDTPPTLMDEKIAEQQKKIAELEEKQRKTEASRDAEIQRVKAESEATNRSLEFRLAKMEAIVTQRKNEDGLNVLIDCIQKPWAQKVLREEYRWTDEMVNAMLTAKIREVPD